MRIDNEFVIPSMMRERGEWLANNPVRTDLTNREFIAKYYTEPNRPDGKDVK